MARVKIAVVGAGIIGLSTAVNIQQSIPEALVTIIADKFGADTTSSGAGGIFRPTAQHIKGVPPDTVRRWSKDSADHFRKIAASADSGRHGVFPVAGYHLLNWKTDPEYKDLIYSFRQMTEEELKKLGTSYRYGYAISTLIVEPALYLPVLLSQFKENGGQTKRRSLQSLEELVGQYDVVVNCTGLGSRWLVNDPKVYPVRGQILKVKAPWIKLFWYTEDDAYIFPRSQDVVLGGVRQTDDYSTEVREADTQHILEKCTKLVPSVKTAEIQTEWSGLRPHRDPVRLETEYMKFDSGTLPVVHNYGHGGNGIALSWGVGLQASRLVKDCVHKLHIKSRL